MFSIYGSLPGAVSCPRSTGLAVQGEPLQAPRRLRTYGGPGGASLQGSSGQWRLAQSTGLCSSGCAW